MADEKSGGLTGTFTKVAGHVLKHALWMVPVMMLAAGPAFAAASVSMTPANALLAGVNGTVDMFVNGIMGIPDFFSNIEWTLDAPSIAWGEFGHAASGHSAAAAGGVHAGHVAAPAAAPELSETAKLLLEAPGP